MKPLKLNLTADEIDELSRLKKRSEVWRVRQRAEELLRLATGVSCTKVAHEMGLTRQTVEATRKAWFAEHLACLADKVRCGAPRKIKPHEAQKILELADASPCSAVDLAQTAPSKQWHACVCSDG